MLLRRTAHGGNELEAILFVFPGDSLAEELPTTVIHLQSKLLQTVERSVRHNHDQPARYLLNIGI